MTKTHTMKPRLYIILGIFQSFVAIGAIPAGLSMITTPDGSGLGMHPELLEGTPFKSLVIPGLFLLIVNGFLNLAAAIISFFKISISGITGLLLGILLSLWIIIQAYYIGMSSFMQPLFFFIGVAEIIISAIIIKKQKG